MAAYLRLLIQNRLAAFKPGSYTKDGKSKLIAVLKVIGFGLLMLLLYGSIAFMEYMLFDLLNGIGQGKAVVGLALLGCTMVTLFYGFFHVNGSLFFSKDTSFLAAMPLRSRTVLTGKMLSIAAGEAGVSLLFCAPLVIGYGIASHAGIAYYLKNFLTFALLPVLPLTVAMLLSFVLIRISALWKRREGVTTILAFVVFAGIMAAEFGLTKLSDEDITKWLLSMLVGKESLAGLLLQKLPWLQWANDGILTAGVNGWALLGLFALVSLAVAAAAVLLMGGGYMKLAIRQSEAIGQVNRGRKRGKESIGERKPVVALMWQEVRDVLTTPVYATNSLFGMIVTPLMICLAMFSSGKVSEFVELREALNLVPRGAYLAVATGVLGLMGTMCMAASSSVSREGKCHEIRKTYPVSGAMQLRAKVYMGIVFHGAGVMVMAVLLCVLLPDFLMENIMAAVCALPLAFLFSIAGVIVDAHHPKLNWKTETEAIKQNFNTMIGMLLGLVLMALLVGAFVLLMKWGMGWYSAFMVVIGLSLVLNALAFGWLNSRSGKAYLAH
ncbi:MAG: hypothetical protein IKC28_05495 [Clostridia bacterium]|nr:hypothetical protein [Clostridia bacterium]